MIEIVYVTKGNFFTVKYKNEAKSIFWLYHKSKIDRMKHLLNLFGLSVFRVYDSIDN